MPTVRTCPYCKKSFMIGIYKLAEHVESCKRIFGVEKQLITIVNNEPVTITYYDTRNKKQFETRSSK